MTILMQVYIEWKKIDLATKDDLCLKRPAFIWIILICLKAHFPTFVAAFKDKLHF